MPARRVIDARLAIDVDPGAHIAPPITPQEQARLPLPFTSDASAFKAVDIGPVRFRRGNWFVAKPDHPGANPQHLWLGEIKGIWQHEGPDGQQRMFLEASWHQAVGSAEGCPVVTQRPTKGAGTSMMWTGHVVPMSCQALQLYERGVPKSGLLQVLSRSWEGLQFLPRLGPVPAAAAQRRTAARADPAH
jgi:hypothetical protein